jgi:chemotaxis protein histidine kinase CheA
MAEEAELLTAFGDEARERCGMIATAMRAIAEGGDSDPSKIEELRLEAHTLKGTAGTLGLERLFELAGLIEATLEEAGKKSKLAPEIATEVANAADAFAEGADAAASESPEPPSVGLATARLFG